MSRDIRVVECVIKVGCWVLSVVVLLCIECGSAFGAKCLWVLIVVMFRVINRNFLLLLVWVV